MLRTLTTAIIASCIFGTLLGFGIAYSSLTVNGWKIELETQSYTKIARAALEKATNPNAKVFIEETTYNFGFKEVKASGTHDFLIQNIGTEDLILTLDRTTCSCTDIQITPNRVLPGKTATCHLIYSADQAMTGSFSQGGIIRTNDPDNREIRLLVEGIFADPVAMRPSTINLPRVPFGESRTATIRFYSFEAEPLQLSAPTWVDHEHFDFQWNPAEFLETDQFDFAGAASNPMSPSSDYVLAAKWMTEGTITVKPGLPVGSFQDRFQVKTNFSSMPSVTFMVSGQIVAGNVAVSGQWYNKTNGVANLGQTTLGKSMSREIFIQFSGPSAPSASVLVKAVEPAWIRTELSFNDAGPLLRIFTLTIEVPEDAPSGSYLFGGGGQQAYVILETNNESMLDLRIPLQFVVGRQ